MNKHRKIERIAGEAGQAATEFALVAPIFLVLMFSIIQFGVVWNNYVTVTDAVRVGAAKASRARGYPDPAAVAEDALRASARDLKQADLTVSVTSPTWERTDDVTVTAQYPFKIKVLGVVIKEGFLKSTTVERIE